MGSSSLIQSLVFFFFFSFPSIILVQSIVPPSKTFKFSTTSPNYPGNVEDNSFYSPLSNLSNHPFSLCFFNSTPNEFILGIGMGTAYSTSLLRKVWTANNARPVKENAKLVFGVNGNLVLVDANGRVAWETRTANMGVVDIKMLPNGNLVLLNKNGGFVWQSFDHPTDTLLVGQGIRPGSSLPNKLVSGSYSMVFDKEEVVLYFKSPLSKTPLRYYEVLRSRDFGGVPFLNVTFTVSSEADGPDYANVIRLEAFSDGQQAGGALAQPKYDSTLSIFRVGNDGNIRVYTYYEKGQNDAWEETFTEFTSTWDNRECLLPEKCGSLGVCENNQCVACPTPKGLMGWSKECKPMKLPSCGVGSTNVSYYEVDGVDHFLSSYNEGEGPMKIEECKKKCSKDCKCMAFFYRKDTSKCLITAQLNTLVKSVYGASTDRVTYIKYAT